MDTLELVTSEKDLTKQELKAVNQQINRLGVAGYAALCGISYEYARKLNVSDKPVKLGYASLVKIRKQLYK